MRRWTKLRTCCIEHITTKIGTLLLGVFLAASRSETKPPPNPGIYGRRSTCDPWPVLSPSSVRKHPSYCPLKAVFFTVLQDSRFLLYCTAGFAFSSSEPRSLWEGPARVFA